MITLNKRYYILLIAIGVLLSIPLIAMQFTNEVNWSQGDFLVMGALLLGLGLLIDFILRKVAFSNSRLAMIIVVVFVFLLIWAELAVGLFGTPFAGN